MTRAFDNNSFMHGLDAYSTVNKGRSSWVVGFYTRRRESREQVQSSSVCKIERP